MKTYKATEGGVEITTTTTETCTLEDLISMRERLTRRHNHAVRYYATEVSGYETELAGITAAIAACK